MATEKIKLHTLASPVFGRNTIPDISISFPLGILSHNGAISILYREFERDFPEEDIPTAPRDLWIVREGDDPPGASGIRLEASLSVPGSLFGETGQIVIHCVECNPV